MDTNKIEKSLRKNDEIVGVWLKLGNGEKWCISPMPLSNKRKIILEKLEALFEKQDAFNQSTTNKDTIKAIDGMLEVASDLVYAVLSVNYPKLTREQFDELDLVNLRHIPQIVSIVKGERELEEMMELQQEKGTSHDEGESKSRATV